MYPWWRATLFAALAFSLPHSLASSPAAPERPWRVLVLNHADPTLPAYVLIERALRSELTAANRPRVDVFSESLDMLRFPEAQFETEMVAFLAKKYAVKSLDIIVANGPAALNFAERHAARLWPEARILFLGIPPELLQGRRLGPNTTGMLRQYDFGAAAELARNLRPSMRRLVVISGSSDNDRRLAELAKSQLAPHAQRFAVEHWQDASVDDFLRRVRILGPDDAVLYLTISRDAAGQGFAPVDLVKRLAEASPAPIYGPFETYVGEGAAAGMVYSFEERGRRMGELVHQVLAARGAPLPPPVESERLVCKADARALQRLGLDAGKLPPGCAVRFLEPSLWREYRWHAGAALLVIAAQAILILALVLQRRGRVRAEGEVRDRRAELAQASRLAMAGQLTASIAHEINQPLGAILANAGAAEALLRRGTADPEELREILADIRSSDLRASDIIRRVRSLITTREAEREAVDVNAMVREALGFLKGEAVRRGVAMDTQLTPWKIELQADRVQLQQALVNLCANAMDAMEDTPPAKRRLEVRTAVAEGEITITVSDNGPGLSAEQLQRVFESFFTTKPHGTGLGLSITRTIAEAHAGRVSAENRPGGGARFRLILPVPNAVVEGARP